jgi:hypothetical protein
MSDRHMHITGLLYDDERVIERFINAAAALDFFAEVVPVRLSGGRIRAVAFLSKDLDGISDELEMPDMTEKLSGILGHDVTIASAWDHPKQHEERQGTPFGHEREYAWVIRGASGSG